MGRGVWGEGRKGILAWTSLFLCGLYTVFSLCIFSLLSFVEFVISSFSFWNVRLADERDVYVRRVWFVPFTKVL